jgi:catechol 2,3-dioxygenase-like lactoylglutathione lyase family enzyme
MELDAIDHIAIPVQNVAVALEWYKQKFNCEVSYQDDTWAFIKFGNIKLALVIPSQHPAHIAFVSPEAGKSGPLKTHRDGTKSCYVTDPSGNSIEIMEPYS